MVHNKRKKSVTIICEFIIMVATVLNNDILLTHLHHVTIKSSFHLTKIAEENSWANHVNSWNIPSNVICWHSFYVVCHFPSSTLFLITPLIHSLSLRSGMQYFLQDLKAAADFMSLAKFKQERGGECWKEAFMQIGCGETLWRYNHQPKQTVASSWVS